MRNTMHKKDLKVKDGFPKDIDREKTVVVAIFVNVTKVIYFNKDAILDWCDINRLYPKFDIGIYILR